MVVLQLCYLLMNVDGGRGGVPSCLSVRSHHSSGCEERAVAVQFSSSCDGMHLCLPRVGPNSLVAYILMNKKGLSATSY